jgi:hypothetical protein
MTTWRKRSSEAADRYEQRKRMEDEAPRLSTAIPDLESLSLQVDERRAGVSTGEAAHIRRVVVENAPALFVVPCRDPACKDGGHDITNLITRALRAKETRFEGEDACNGSVGSANCQRIMHFVATASYRA